MFGRMTVEHGSTGFVHRNGIRLKPGEIDGADGLALVFILLHSGQNAFHRLGEES